MDEDRKKVMIEKVLKLLELGDADKNSNPNERETAMRMAAKLMADYSIDFVDLRDGQKKDNTFLQVDVTGASTTKVSWQSSLAGAIAKTFDCKCINRYPPTGWVLTFVGTKSDLEIATFFFKSLRRTVGRLGETNFRKVADRNTYCFGMVNTISERLEDLFARREAFIPSDCKALVIRKTQELDKFYHDAYPHITKGRTIKLTGSHVAYSQGREDGKRVALNRPISHSGSVSAQIGG
jgi:hypothetical protein